MKRILKVLSCGMLSACLASAALSVNLQPATGQLNGQPGDTLGWGFSIFNFGLNQYDVVTSSWFCDPGQNPASTTCAPALGTYTDFIASNGTVIAPNQNVSQPYDPLAMTGLGSFAIFKNAPAGGDAGTIVLTYDVYDADPFSGSANLILSDQQVSTHASVEVQPTTTPVPEPGTVAGIGLGLVALAANRRRRRR